ncbi:MAG: hypothetical protein PHT49_09250 [Desulfovibrionales bacterium]|nr:hypothetical protein [Desulfovibrionales bacterium]
MSKGRERDGKYQEKEECDCGWKYRCLLSTQARTRKMGEPEMPFSGFWIVQFSPISIKVMPFLQRKRLVRTLCSCLPARSLHHKPSAETHIYRL